MVAQVFVADPVEFVGADTWHYVPTHFRKGIRSNSASDAHGLDSVHITDIGPLVGSGPRLANVFGTGNSCGDRTFR